MAKISKNFPSHRFGPKFLNLCQEWGKTTKVTSWGPDLAGIDLKGRGLKWRISATTWAGFTAYSECGRYRWQGKFIDAETDFDL